MRPQLYENIGMAARAMDNFGLSKLSIVSPRDGWPSKKAKSAAKQADKIINKAKVYDHLEDAVSNFDLVIASEITTEPNSSPGIFFKDCPREPTAVLVAEVITIDSLIILLIYRFE